MITFFDIAPGFDSVQIYDDACAYPDIKAEYRWNFGQLAEKGSKQLINNFVNAFEGYPT
jgi:hypothetical protein